MKAQDWRSEPQARRQEGQAQVPARYFVLEARRYHGLSSLSESCFSGYVPEEFRRGRVDL